MRRWQVIRKICKGPKIGLCLEVFWNGRNYKVKQVPKGHYWRPGEIPEFPGYVWMGCYTQYAAHKRRNLIKRYLLEEEECARSLRV